MPHGLTVRQYKLPRQSGLFTLPLPDGNYNFGFSCLGLASLSGEMHLIVREPQVVARRAPATFVLAESEETLPPVDWPFSNDYQGSFDCDGKLKHLFVVKRAPLQREKIC